jgi:NAD(P)-dependent dehydrogenase (short-subunit alcohol dehydrogenase family)
VGGKLDGKSVLVTGASRGIGKGIARVFLREGARVFLSARQGATLAATAEELSRIGPEVAFHAGDVSIPHDAEELIHKALERFPDLTVLVNNASILGDRAPLRAVDPETWNEVLRVNTSSLFYVTRPLIPVLVKRGAGSIINVSSGVGRHGKANWGPYAVSKFGVEGFTQVLAEELQPHGIRVNSVNPGGTRTEMRAAAYPDEDPLTLPTPEDIAPVFVYLASDESKDRTGLAYEARDYIEKED